MSSLETLAGLLMASLTPTMLYSTAPSTMPLSFSKVHIAKANIKETSKAAPPCGELELMDHNPLF